MTKVLLVTGAGSGIGAKVAERAARDGWKLAINYRNNRDGAEALVQAITAAGGDAAHFRGDMAVESDITRLFQAVDDRFGRLDGLVNNAGITGRRCTVEEVDGETLDQVFRTNVFAYFLCAREAVRRMSTKYGHPGGAIVNISSIAAIHGNPFDWVHYAASKAAVDMLTQGLALEVAADGIRVNAVRPGVTFTGMDPERIRRIAPGVPMQRAARPEEIAEAVVWLLSDAASYTTAAHLNVAGGRR